MTLRPLRWLVLSLVLLLAVGAGGMTWYLNGSLAPLDGEQLMPGLNAKVTVDRDAQGIPTISASNRADTAYALGVLHAQERFFQMDLLRRNSAGELSGLVGADAINHDKKIRIHQFRVRAERAAAELRQKEAKLLMAYTRGVNAGLQALTTRPFEYLLLQADPVPWQPADSLLVLFSMYMDLQPIWNQRERSLAVLRDSLPRDWYDFLTPEGGQWDSPVHGERYEWQAGFPVQPLSQLQMSEHPVSTQLGQTAWAYRDAIEVGSNNWSVSGALSASGAAMVANDMHLGLSVPNIWYRASWFLDDGRRVTGATLPGAPSMVVGSNQSVAWGFTNSNGDYHDSIALKTNGDGSKYLTEQGWETFRIKKEFVHVKGGETLELAVRTTRWGPVIGEDHRGELLALRWVAHDPEGANLDSLLLENANTIYEAMDFAASAGMPAQNLNVVDHLGNQAWTIMGRLPRRVGFTETGASPLATNNWSNGELGWDGYLHAREYPRIVNPEHGRIWTANARIVSDDLLDTVGRGGYALGARQQQIEEGLFARDQHGESDFLAIALDDRALFLQRWQQLLLASIADHPDLQELKHYVREWEERASASSVGYLAVKRFREQVIDATVGSVFRQIKTEHASDDVFWPRWVDNYLEYPVWALVEQQPKHHVPAGYNDWPSFITNMASLTLETLTAEGNALSEQTWGKANALTIRHPLSQAVPALSRWLDMPAEPMPGDTYMPRVQSRSGGASERMIVSPGREEHGIFHMATGQSGHFLSPYFDAGHRDWVEGKASAFLPGETQWRMTLSPE